MSSYQKWGALVKMEGDPHYDVIDLSKLQNKNRIPQMGENVLFSYYGESKNGLVVKTGVYQQIKIGYLQKFEPDTLAKLRALLKLSIPEKDPPNFSFPSTYSVPQGYISVSVRQDMPSCKCTYCAPQPYTFSARAKNKKLSKSITDNDKIEVERYPDKKTQKLDIEKINQKEESDNGGRENKVKQISSTSTICLPESSLPLSVTSEITSSSENTDSAKEPEKSNIPALTQNISFENNNGFNEWEPKAIIRNPIESSPIPLSTQTSYLQSSTRVIEAEESTTPEQNIFLENSNNVKEKKEKMDNLIEPSPIYSLTQTSVNESNISTTPDLNLNLSLDSSNSANEQEERTYNRTESSPTPLSTQTSYLPSSTRVIEAEESTTPELTQIISSENSNNVKEKEEKICNLIEPSPIPSLTSVNESDISTTPDLNLNLSLDSSNSANKQEKTTYNRTESSPTPLSTQTSYLQSCTRVIEAEESTTPELTQNISSENSNNVKEKICNLIEPSPIPSLTQTSEHETDIPTTPDINLNLSLDSSNSAKEQKEKTYNRTESSHTFSLTQSRSSSSDTSSYGSNSSAPSHSSHRSLESSSNVNRRATRRSVQMYKEEEYQHAFQPVFHGELVQIGANGNKIPMNVYNQLKGKYYKSDTSQLLNHFFKKETLSRHVVTIHHAEEKPELNPEIVADIVNFVSIKCNIENINVKYYIQEVCRDLRMLEV